MGDNWEMPEPIFRSSDGEEVGATKLSANESLEGSEHETLEPAVDSTPNDNRDTGNETPTDALASLYEPPESLDDDDEQVTVERFSVEEIQEQPLVSEEFSAGELLAELPAAAEAVQPKRQGSTGLRILVFVFLVGVLVTAGVFLYWYLTAARHD